MKISIGNALDKNKTITVNITHVLILMSMAKKPGMKFKKKEHISKKMNSIKLVLSKILLLF